MQSKITKIAVLALALGMLGGCAAPPVDSSAIDAAMEELNTVFQAASQEMYNASQAQGGQPGQPGPDAGQQPGPDAGAQQGQPKDDGEVTDVDFEEVK